MKAIERVLDKLYALVMFICKIALIADILITSYAVEAVMLESIFHCSKTRHGVKKWFLPL